MTFKTMASMKTSGNELLSRTDWFDSLGSQQTKPVGLCTKTPRALVVTVPLPGASDHGHLQAPLTVAGEDRTAERIPDRRTGVYTTQWKGERAHQGSSVGRKPDFFICWSCSVHAFLYHF